MTAQRAVRIPKGGAPRVQRAVRVPVGHPTRELVPPALPGSVRENAAGVQRANRVALIYVAAILVVFAVLALYARSAPGGTSSGSALDQAIFGGVALLLAAVGVLLSLSSAPRRVELAASATIIQGRFGGRLRLPPRAELEVRVVRRFPAGFLSSGPVEHVEIVAKPKGRRRGFLVEEHLLDPTGSVVASP